MAERTPSVALQFFDGAIWTAARNLLQTVLTLAALAVIARELGPEAYGVFGIAMVVIGVAEMLVGGALTESLVQYRDLRDGHVDATFWLTTLSALALGGLIAAFAAPLARLAGGAEAAGGLTALACVLPVGASARVPMALLARDLRFRPSAQIGALATILSCSTGIVLAWRGAGIFALVAMEAVRSTAHLTGALLVVSWRPGRRGQWRHLSELSRFNTTMIAAYGLGYADMLLPRLLISRLLGAEMLGLFMLAMRVHTELYQMLTGSLHAVAMAACARTQHLRDELQRLVLGLYRAARLIVFPAYLGLAAIAPQLVPAVFGPEWIPAIPAIQMLLLAGIRDASGAFTTPILFGVGRTGLPLYLLAAASLLHLALIPSLAPWGIVGVAGALLGRQFATWPLAWLLIERATALPIRRQLEGTWPVLLAALTMAALTWLGAALLTPHLSAAAVIVLCAASGVVLYIAALRVLAPHLLDDAAALGAAFVRRDRSRLETLLSASS
jgi:PST family polysaccharide transporter